MRTRVSLLAGAVFWIAPFPCAQPLEDWAGGDHDVFILGEVHDNAQHHALQARAIAMLEPAAVVFEMLTPEEAEALSSVPREPQAMAEAVDGFHWDNIADYAGILAASPRIRGAAAEPGTVRAAFSDGAAASFGADAADYGLDLPLPGAERAAREALQFDAHCEAMPEDMMGGMVEAQRLRDAAFARAVIAALDAYGPPVVLITGNGHARADWGVPAYLARARPDLDVFTLGQGEDGAAPAGGFDAVLADAPEADRPDPCAVFR